MAKSKKNMMKKKKQQPVSQETFRTVVETDTWCNFKKRNESSKAPYGYVVEVSKKIEFNNLPQDLPKEFFMYNLFQKSAFMDQNRSIRFIVLWRRWQNTKNGAF